MIVYQPRTVASVGTPPNGYARMFLRDDGVFVAMDSQRVVTPISGGTTTAPTTAANVSAASGGTVEDAIWHVGRSAPVAGSKMEIRWLRDNALFPLENEAGIWGGPVVTDHGISATFNAGEGGANAPTAGLFVMANNNGSSGDVCGAIFDAVARTNNATVFGANIIARGTGKANCKFVGLEIDVVPSSGDFSISSGSGGLYLNIFNKALSGAAIQIGAVGGGSFGNGLVLGGLASTAAGVALESSSQADSLINTTVGTFNTSAILLGSGNTRGIKWSGSTARVWFDGTNVREVLPSGASWIWRDTTDATSLVSIDNSGNVRLESGGTVFFGSGLSSTTATAGAQTLPANPVGFLTVNIGGTNRKIPYYA